jgi:hypothetical protein
MTEMARHGTQRSTNLRLPRTSAVWTCQSPPLLLLLLVAPAAPARGRTWRRVKQRGHGGSEQAEERLCGLVQKMGEEKARTVAAEPGAASRDGDHRSSTPGGNNDRRRRTRTQRSFSTILWGSLSYPTAYIVL